MKLSGNLPKRNGLDESDLPSRLISSPRAHRLLVVEVVASKVETIYDEDTELEYDVPTAKIVRAEYVDDPRDITAAQLIAQRARAKRTGRDALPGLEGIAREFRDSVASTLGVGESLTIGHAGKSATVPGGRVDAETGEIIDGGGES